MAKVEIKLNSSGIRELLRSKEMLTICEEHAEKAVSKLGDGYTSSSMTGKNRVNAEIATESFKAMAQNMKHNSILKALR